MSRKMLYGLLTEALGEEEWIPPALPSIDALSTKHGSDWEGAIAMVTGPTAQSNWIIPGHVLTGSLPQSQKALELLVKAGVTTFFSLQTRKEGYPYRSYASRLLPSITFDEQPIVDQQVTTDDLAMQAVVRILQRVRRGEVIYLHCRGGHGRTGTIGSLLLGLVYSLSAPFAMVMWQALHDSRQRPCFCAPHYNVANYGEVAVTLFKIQQKQVLRILSRSDTGFGIGAVVRGVGGASEINGDINTQEDNDLIAGLEATCEAASTRSSEAGEVELRQGNDLIAGLGATCEAASTRSSEAGEVELRQGGCDKQMPRIRQAEGASTQAKHFAACDGNVPHRVDMPLQEWRQVGEAAMTAFGQRDWGEAVRLLRRSVALRPDWPKGYLCLARALDKLGDSDGKLEVLHKGIEACVGLECAEAAEKLQSELSAHMKRTASTCNGGHICQDRDESGSRSCAEEAPRVSEESGSAVQTAELHSSRKQKQSTQKETPGEGDVSNECAQDSQPRTQPSSQAARLPRLVMLVGLPGAGKSTFAEALAASTTVEWTVVCQDTLGGRKATEDAILTAWRAGKRLVIDRCNVQQNERREVLSLVMNGAARQAECVAVHFATPIEECTRRAALRTDHPTIGYGRGRSAVVSMSKRLEPPTTAEGFRETHIITTDEDAAGLLRSWGAEPASPKPLGFFKFPRTHHVLNTGGYAVTRDDLVMSSVEAARFFDGTSTVTVEEKVDGANLGLSLTKNYEVRAQNRSHFVTSQTHSQFRQLDAWIDDNSWALCQLLKPEEEVLFGEWCYAQHTVAYSHLPGLFLAFDIYNKRTRRFCSVDERDRRLCDLNIPVIRQITRQVFTSQQELLDLLETDSAYGEGKVEGVYLRIDGSNAGPTPSPSGKSVEACSSGHGKPPVHDRADVELHLLYRGKIVRPDFVQSIQQHWAAKELVKNGISSFGGHV